MQFSLSTGLGGNSIDSHDRFRVGSHLKRKEKSYHNELSMLWTSRNSV